MSLTQYQVMIFTTKRTKIFLVVQWDGSYEVNITNGDFGDQIRMVGIYSNKRCVSQTI